MANAMATVSNSERGMYDLNLALDQLMSRLNVDLPTTTIETRKSYRAVPAQAFEMMVSAVESVLFAAANVAPLRKIRMDNGFSTIGDGFSGLMSSGSPSYAYLAADLQYESELSGTLLPFNQHSTGPVRVLSNMAERNGGYLQVETASSDTLRFMLRLPIAVAESWELSTGLAGPRETILLVEDEEFVRNVTQEVLEMEGFKVLGAATGTEAIEMLAKDHTRVDLLLTDVVLPGINGRDLAARMSEMQPGLKVIFMSGYTDNAVLKNSVAESTTPYLQKPFTLDALVTKVHETLEILSVASMVQRAALNDPKELR
jgi:CheY-like chemotaxis protein